MSEINRTGFGTALRRRREELKLSLDDVAASTRIRKTYLHALEEENLPALPGAAYSIGFLRIYARHLGLPAESLLSSLAVSDSVDEKVSSISAGSDSLHSTPKAKRKGKGGRWLLLFLLLGGGAAAAYFWWQGQTFAPKPQAVAVPVESKPEPAVNSPAQGTPPIVASAPVPEQPAAVPAQPAVPVTELPVLPAGGAIVRMLPVAGGIMKVSLDNQELREYQLQPEQSLNWKVTSSLACELSAPGLVRVWVDQQEITLAEYPAFILKGVLQQPQRQ